MNVGTLKTLSYLSSLGLLGGIGYVGYDFWKNGQNQEFYDHERTTKLLGDVTPPPAPKRLGLNYNNDIKPAMLGFDWTGEPPAEPVPEKTQEEIEKENAPTPVAEILDVKSIFCAPKEPSDSLCLLDIKMPDVGDDLWFGIGDTLPAPNGDIAIFSIDANSVTFSFKDEARAKESLEPSSLKDDLDTQVITSVDDASKIRKPNGLRSITPGVRAAKRETTERINGQIYVGTNDAAEFSANYQQILANDVKLETYMKDGKRAGLKVREVKPGSMAARHGVQAEDVVISINGTSITSEQQGIQYVRQNSDTTSVWRVQILRNGRVVEEVYHSPEE